MNLWNLANWFRLIYGIVFGFRFNILNVPSSIRSILYFLSMMIYFLLDYQTFADFDLLDQQIQVIKG